MKLTKLCVICSLVALVVADKSHEKLNVKQAIASDLVDHTRESDQQRSKPTNNTTAQCVNDEPCFDDGDCLTGKCDGPFVGTCDCGACVNFRSCTDDSGCGGLQGACDSVAGFCNCIAGLKSNGFKHYSDALRSLCNMRHCDRNSSQLCFGLPCNAGHCIC
ncbi:Chondroitin proteoglycan 3 [Toxocara canis]|uniref:Chondroitin proteoglycan 3 n=1 Tax=Toxocara canis TaxID=6265 RepID=A0A0B2W795_TOXCA|nr:Chondroitin proteoglycan 3 [Toxocara canis]